jgi:ABC-type transport system involved in cytochrome bd biosynthesis fused ATPase/permease subunit
VPAGGTLSIVGPSGVGKSTLLRAIAGLDELADGEILVDGASLADLDRERWHQIAAWLPQDPVLPGECVADAVRAGRDGIDDTTITELLGRLGVDLDLTRPLGESAAALSAGQRRRVALARALAGRPAVLVLDEPTAHLDADSEARVIAAVAASGATVIVATHRAFPADVSVSLEAPERFRA